MRETARLRTADSKSLRACTEIPDRLFVLVLVVLLVLENEGNIEDEDENDDEDDVPNRFSIHALRESTAPPQSKALAAAPGSARVSRAEFGLSPKLPCFGGLHLAQRRYWEWLCDQTAP